MRSVLIAGSAAVALGGCVSASGGSVAVAPDILTVSGRQALPSAAPGSRLAEQLSVGQIILADGAASALSLEPDGLRTSLRQAFARSLANHGYSAEADAGTPVTLTVAAPTVVVEDDATIVTVDLSFRVDADRSELACLTHATQTSFRAIRPLNSGGGERTAAVVSTVLMAAVGAQPGAFMAEQFRNADAENAALNAGRAMAAGEAVTPRGQSAARFGGVHALRLGLTDYIAHLGTAPACEAAGNGPPAAT